jgi:hypothetical protein
MCYLVLIMVLGIDVEVEVEGMVKVEDEAGLFSSSSNSIRTDGV